MSTKPEQEVLLKAEPSDQVELPLATEGVARWMWESRFGSMLIEVREGHVFVNGELVEQTLIAERR